MQTREDLLAAVRSATIDEFVDSVFAFMVEHGDAHYGEDVTQLVHALQAAAMAEEEDGRDELVAAALLHDLGHMFEKPGDDDGVGDEDLFHEDLGAAFLEPYFPPMVTDPIREHVNAKRYLCAVDPSYREGLSEASVKTLALQGGPMSAEECRAFEGNPHLEAILMVRRWDDRAKEVGMALPPLESYRRPLRRILKHRLRDCSA